MARDAFINTNEAVAILKEANGGRRGISHRTVQRMAVSGELPYVQRIPFGPHGAYLFDRTVIELYARQVEAKARRRAELEQAKAS